MCQLDFNTTSAEMKILTDLEDGTQAENYRRQDNRKAATYTRRDRPDDNATEESTCLKDGTGWC